MNQTKKRLQIIKLAISIGDTETIQLQMLKLSALKTDDKIQEIIKGLQAENYAQTQALITEYIETPIEEILQRTSQNKRTEEEDDEAIIEEFDLFRVKTDEEEENYEEILDLNGFKEKPDSQNRSEPEVDFDALLNLKSDDVLTDNIKIEQTRLPQDDFFDHPDTTERYNYTEVIEKDDFFDVAPTALKEEKSTKDDLFNELLHIDETSDKETLHSLSDRLETDIPDIPTVLVEEKEESPYTPISEISPVHTSPHESSQQKKIKEKPKLSPSKSSESPNNPLDYEPIPYIDQKLKNMQTQYPPLEEPEGNLPSVDAWLIKISKEGYTEKEIEEMITYIHKLSDEGKKAEAAQLLLISAATHSKYAQFMLARSLFKGDLLEKNLPEAFTLINRLALDDEYPEAICDLGQLYENGIGIDRDKKRAEALYQEAMELGIKRASAHYERVHRENKGLFRRLFSKK